MKLTPIIALSIATLAGCQSMNANRSAAPQAVAWVRPAEGQSVTGSVRFVEMNGGNLLVIEDFNNLSPGPHGVHLHQSPDLSAPDLGSAGPHFNPTNQPHAGPGTQHRHAGDLGNVVAGPDGHAHLELVVHNLSISGPTNGVIGHSVIVHAGSDDLRSQPAGNSGARIGGGVVVAEK